MSTKYFVFKLVDEALTARARLDEVRAPRTVAALWERAPYSGTIGHAIFSGTTVALYIDPAIVLPQENVTAHAQTGDLMFMHYDEGLRHGFPDALSEIFWAYDRYCRPTMPGAMMPICANVFGRFEPDSEVFFAACGRTRDEGRKRIEILAKSD